MARGQLVDDVRAASGLVIQWGLAVAELFGSSLGMATVLGEVCHRPFDVGEQFEPELA